jgi:molybdopterin/thiamine biosynthesis adenylyltransferase
MVKGGGAPLDLSREEDEYYSRQIVLDSIDYAGQQRLRDSEVCLIGLGGLGSTIAPQLASMGVGSIRLIDRDVVELSNLHRQQLYTIDSIGYPKVEVAAKRLRNLNPFVEVIPMPISIHEGNILDSIGGVDVVVDGLDAVRPRRIINRACQELGIPYVYGAALRQYGSVMTIIPGKTACLECLLGTIDDEEMPTCATVGVHPSILGLVGSMEVSETVSLIVRGESRLKGKLLFFDMESMELEKISIVSGEGCQVCGPNAMPAQESTWELVEELCGRKGRSTFVVAPWKNLDIDMGHLYDLIDIKGVSYVAKGEMGLTFDMDDRRVSMLSSGVMILEGFDDEKEAVRFYESILVEELGIASDLISP